MARPSNMMLQLARRGALLRIQELKLEAAQLAAQFPELRVGNSNGAPKRRHRRKLTVQATHKKAKALRRPFRGELKLFVEKQAFTSARVREEVIRLMPMLKVRGIKTTEASLEKALRKYAYADKAVAVAATDQG